MLAVEDVIQWLREGEDWEAAAILSECAFTYDEFVDWDMRIEVEMAGYDYQETYVLKIEAPRRIINGISDELKPIQMTIENAIRQCTQTRNIGIQWIDWVPKLGSTAGSPPDPEIESVLATVDSDHVHAAWIKAMNRRRTDPDGAITAAKTLVESVCKHILSDKGIAYPPNADIPKLYHMVSEQLTLSPAQHVDKSIKRVLGNCEAVVGGIAFIRNSLGDAHSPDPGVPAGSVTEAELAVNLAGAVATFLIRTWERQNEDTEQESQG